MNTLINQLSILQS